MGILRSLGKFFGGLIFSLSLVLLIFCFVFAQLTEYKILQPLFVSLVEKQLGNQYSSEQLDLTYMALQDQCKSKEKITIPINQQDIKEITLKCSDISSSKPSDIPKLMSIEIFNNLYYKKYECGFIQCLQQPGIGKFTMLLSSHANKFFYSLITYLAIGLVVGIVIIAISARDLYGTIKSIGMSCIFVGILYFLIPFMKNSVMKQLPPEIISSTRDILNQVLLYLSNLLLYVLIAGVILTALGYIGNYLSKGKTKGGKKI